MQLRLRQSSLDLSQPVVMGILNVTPDSFSDGGNYVDVEVALHRARDMVTEGAAIIDIGGESTRPGAAPVSAQQELDRVVPVVERLAKELECAISIDTMKPVVMDAACAAGASLINDVNALQAPGAIEVARRHGAAVCLMHMRGEPRTMQQQPQYDDVVAEVRDYLQQRLEACLAGDISREKIVLDPGFGFGKALDHNLRLLAELPALLTLGQPLLVGLSRKSMFGMLLGSATNERLPAGLAAATIAVWHGAAIVRTHDVRATVDAVRVGAALRAARQGL